MLLIDHIATRNYLNINEVYGVTSARKVTEIAATSPKEIAHSNQTSPEVPLDNVAQNYYNNPINFRYSPNAPIANPQQKPKTQNETNKPNILEIDEDVEDDEEKPSKNLGAIDDEDEKPATGYYVTLPPISSETKELKYLEDKYSLRSKVRRAYGLIDYRIPGGLVNMAF